MSKKQEILSEGIVPEEEYNKKWLGIYPLNLRRDIKNYLYDKSPLRNKFQVRPLEPGELVIYKNYKYGRVIKEDKSGSYQIINNQIIPLFFELSCFYKNSDDITEKICEDMFLQERLIYRKLKRYYIEKRKGVLLIRTDIQVLPVNERKIKGYTAFELIGAVVLGK